MTDLDKLEIVNEALLHEISRIKTDDCLLKIDLNKAGERVSALAVCRLLLEIERNLNSKIQELLKKNDQLEAELISLHETLEKTESELANLQSQNLFLMNFVPEDCDCKMKGECRLCPKYTDEKQ